jgi:hypothetical protein
MLKTVSTQLALASDTLSEILANGNTSGPNNIIMDAGYGINGTLGAITPASVVATTGRFNNNGNENLFIADTANTSRSSFQVSDTANYFNANIDSASHGYYVWRSSNAYTERLRIDASGHAIIPAGVTLGTAAGVYAAANTLDDYEEGVWTPAPAGGTLTINDATYTKVGRLVTAQADVTATATTSGDWSGLPFNLGGSLSADKQAGFVGYQTEESSAVWGILADNTLPTFTFRNGSSGKQLTTGSRAVFTIIYYTN